MPAPAPLGPLTDPSTPLHVDVDARLPASWALSVVLVVVHGVTAVGWSVEHARPVWAGLLLDRPRAMRVGVGGQALRQLEDGELWRLATSSLLHADAVHLTLNVVGLLALGRLVEPLVGAWRMVSWFVLGALAGGVASWAAGVRFSDGASGGAYALMGAITVIGWTERGHTVDLDQRLFGLWLWVFLVGNVALSFALPMIDVAGHLGGLAMGIVVGLFPGRSGRGPVAADVAVVLAFVAACCAGWCTLGWA
ncbi:MAG: rhomboid protease GluP [Myxococcota bacterium]